MIAVEQLVITLLCGDQEPLSGILLAGIVSANGNLTTAS